MWNTILMWLNNLQVISIKDNDTLSALLSVELKADLLMILSDVQGIYSGPPDQPDSRLLDTFRPYDMSSIEFGSKSRVGRGGMESKVKVCIYHFLIWAMVLILLSTLVIINGIIIKWYWLHHEKRSWHWDD